MRVLLLADSDERYADGAETLRRAGHDVVGCHDDGSTAGRWPCVGVDHDCPLDQGVDVAVAFHDDPAVVEAGVGCVVRQKVPLVLGGRATSGPAAAYARAVVDDTGDALAAAVASAESAALPDLSDAATTALAELAERLDLGGDLRAEVFRHRRTLTVVVHGPEVFDASQRAACSQAAFAAVRDVLPSTAADVIDVTFTPEG